MLTSRRCLYTFVYLQQSFMTSRTITIGAYPAESGDYVCFVPLRHYQNSPLHFSFFTVLLS